MPPPAPKPAPGPPVSLFPRVPSTSLTRNKKLDDAVGKAVANLVKATPGNPPAAFGLTIVDLQNNNAMGGRNDDQEFYGASLLKLTVMYAGFALRDMVRRYNSLRNPKTPDALFKGLRADIDPKIESSSALILGGASHAYRVPNYEQVFNVTALGADKVNVEFTHQYALDTFAMIVPGDNAAAASCIHGIGYGYLNGVLEQGGFFKSKEKKGLWLASDFLTWPTVEIPCVNDVTTHQGCTTQECARLLAVILTDSVLPGDAHGLMTRLLKSAASGDEPSWLTRQDTIRHLSTDQVTHGKIGKGPLKGKRGNVFSEVCFVKSIALDSATYIVSYANIDFNPYTLGDIATVIRDAITTYEP
jgi:hypothetical protein